MANALTTFFNNAADTFKTVAQGVSSKAALTYGATALAFGLSGCEKPGVDPTPTPKQATVVTSRIDASPQSSVSFMGAIGLSTLIPLNGTAFISNLDLITNQVRAVTTSQPPGQDYKDYILSVDTLNIDPSSRQFLKPIDPEKKVYTFKKRSTYFYSDNDIKIENLDVYLPKDGVKISSLRDGYNVRQVAQNAVANMNQISDRTSLNVQGSPKTLPYTP